MRCEVEQLDGLRAGDAEVIGGALEAVGGVGGVALEDERQSGALTRWNQTKVIAGEHLEGGRGELDAGHP